MYLMRAEMAKGGHADAHRKESMLQIGKTAQNAIAAMSYLAECYRDKRGAVSSQTISDARGISKPLVAKILTILSQAGCVIGSTGPGGGYQLAKKPTDIRLLDVVSCFELQNKRVACPFGEDWCGKKEPCPLHDEIMALSEDMERFLRENHFGGFAAAECLSPTSEG